MRFPLSVGRRDVLVRLNDDDVTVGDVVAAAAADGADDAVRVGSRFVGRHQPMLAAAIRPGDQIAAPTLPPPQPEVGDWTVQVVAGVDAGRVILLPRPGPDGVSVVTVGRDPAMVVRLHSGGVSKHHCTIHVGDDGVTVTDAGSSNGTVVRGEAVGSTPVTVEVGEMIRCGPALLVVRAAQADDTPRTVQGALAGAPSGPVPFYRSPVDLAPAPPDEIELPAPPRRPRTGRPGLLMMVLPLVGAGLLVYFTKQWYYAMFALMSPLMMLMTTVDRAGRNRRIRRTSKRRYRQEVIDFTNELDEAVVYEIGRRWQMHPDAVELVRRAQVAGAALWSRRRDHPQFLELSLGVGDVPWSAPVGTPAEQLIDLEDIIDQRSHLPNSPLSVPMPAGTTIGLAGERTAALATARGLLTQAITLHGPAEVRVVLCCAEAAAAEWEWLKWAPHVRPTYAEGRLLAAVSDAEGRLDGSDIDEVLADVDASASLFVVVDTRGLADAGDLAVRRLLRDAPTSGVVIAPTVDGLPDSAAVVVEHHEAVGEATVRWPREGGRSLDVVAGGMPAAVATTVTRALARLSDPDAGGGSASLPGRIGLVEMLDLASVTPPQIQSRWAGDRAFDVLVGVGESGPITVNLDRDGPHLVVVGARGSGKTEALSSMVFALATEHPPEQLHLLLWGESFGHLHRLPHVASQVSRIDEGTLNLVMEGLDRELTRRERRRTDASAESKPSHAKLAIVIDDIDTITRVVPKAMEDFVRLLRRARGVGVHVMWSTSRASGGPISELIDLSAIRVVQRVQHSPDSSDLLGSDSAARLERSLPGRGYLVAGRADPREVQGAVVSVGAPRPEDRLDVAPFSLASARRADLAIVVGEPDERFLVTTLAAAGATSLRPADLLSTTSAMANALESPGLLELLGLDGPDGLAVVPERWHTIDSDSFLRVPIGVDTEVRPVLLDLKEAALAGMGPHGLLVGATGAGKSELLRTLVAGLALTHAPEALAFVLVDFKGGASFASLGALPHVAGVVTNLADDLALVDRILAALSGEQRRRQEVLAQAGNLANAREYRAARAEGRLPPALGDAPLPQLLVVVDEFAELLDQEPAFIEFFLTIGRVGRSLGIHLLLASQRLEEGKLRGLDTYLSYRLGLRTFSAAESRTVLGVPDAYSLPSAPGAGYLKVATTSFDRFQASYVSGPAVGDSGPSVLDTVIASLRDSADKVHQIWLAPLSDAIPLDPMFGEAGFVHDPHRGFAAAGWPLTGRLAVPIGTLDEPDRQRQIPLVIDFGGAHGHLALAGAPQSGKSVMLRTLLLSLAVTHTPDEVQVYGVDFGGGTLSAMADLPHVGTVASRLEPDLVQRLIGHVEALLGEREQVFRTLGVDSISTFRQRRNDGDLPEGTNAADIFLVIDGWAAFREKFEVLEPTIADIAARGLGYGIHVVVSLSRWMEMRPTVLDSIGGRLELRLNAAIDSMIDRKRAAVIRADQPGRGLHPSARVFQTALPRLDGAATAANVAEATRLAVAHIASRWSGPATPPVRLLPTRVTLGELPEATGGGVTVGLSEAGMSAWQLDLRGGEPHFFVYGDGESGKTTLLQTWLEGLAASTTPEQSRIVLVDYRRTSLETADGPHRYAYAASEPAAQDVIARVADEMQSRLPGADVTAAQLRDRSWWSGPDIYVVVDDYDLVVTPGGNPLSPLLPYLAQARDVGLHVVLARRVAGAAKAFYEPITARIREVSPQGIVMSGEREEGPIIGAVRAAPQPPGRGIVVTRRRPPVLVQVAVDEPAAEDQPTDQPPVEEQPVDEA